MVARLTTMILGVFLLAQCSSVSDSNIAAEQRNHGASEGVQEAAPHAVTSINKYAPLVGSYEFAQRVHANEFYPDEVSNVMVQISDFFADPGQMLINTILDQAFRSDRRGKAITIQGLEFAAGFAIFWLPEADLNGDYRVSFSELFNYSLFRLTPREVSETFNFLNDVNSILTQLDVGGHLDISTANPDGSLSGSYGLDSYMVRISFMHGCDTDNACCGRRVFSGADMGLEPFSAEFTGIALADRDGLGFDVTLDPHRVALAYGNIVHYLVRDVLLPEVAGTHDLAEAFESLLGAYKGQEGCAGVGAFFSQYGFTSKDKRKNNETLCRNAITTLSWQLEDIMDQLLFLGVDEANLEAQLNARFEAWGQDRTIDGMYGDGLWTVTLGDYVPEVSSEWRGARVFEPCDEDTTCISGDCIEVESVLNTCDTQWICR